MQFSDLVGFQKEKAFFDQLEESGLLGHAYILYGPERRGKFLFAKVFGEYLERGGELGSAPLFDSLAIEPDSSRSIGIDAVREAKKFLSEKPFKSKRRTLVIRDGEKLTSEAQNALLKITEEPPESSLIFFILSDPERILPTLRSRFQEVQVPPASSLEIEEWLTKVYALSSEQSRDFANLSRGLPGLAYSYSFDESFKKNLEVAGKFISSSASLRAALVKDLTAEEDFEADEFLEALLFIVSQKKEKYPAFLHAIFDLRRSLSYFNLNQRLQLTALGRFLD